MSNQIKSVTIVYFSGTGNTRKVAECLKNCFIKKELSVQMYSLADIKINSLPDTDLLIVAYAVYALNAPTAIYRWINSLPAVNGKQAAVISVSGGGEISPNTACRVGCIRRLARKGYKINYETMLVMPSNVVVATDEALAVKLLEILPQKVEQIVDDIVSGKGKRTKPLLFDRVLAGICKTEKFGTRIFGKKIQCGPECTGCGWCSNHCPAGNIQMENSRPVFGNNCNICLSCIYGCPQKALKPGFMKFILIKDGYDLKKLEQKTPWPEPVNVDKLAKGLIWAGIRKYLQS